MESLRSRWAGVGRSQSTATAEAARRATLAAVAGRTDAKLLVVLCSERHASPSLLEGIAEVSAGAPVIGCSTAGEIAGDGPGQDSVVVFAIGGPGFVVRTHAARDASHDLRGVGADAASCVAAIDGSPHRVLMLLTDALAGDQQEILRGVYAVAGAGVPLVGGCAGDDLKMTGTFQFHGRQVLQDAVVSAAIGSDAPIGIGVRHGWRTIGEPMLVTRSDGNVVYEINDRPALDVYLELLDAPPAASANAAAFTRFALIHPLGLARRSGEPHVRFVSEADFAGRGLVCIAAIPEGATVWLMEGDVASVLHATDAACADALAMLDGAVPHGVLAFDCIARRGVLGDGGVQQEVSRIAKHMSGAPVAGFYTYGEIARTRGISGFHNQTLVVLALA